MTHGVVGIAAGLRPRRIRHRRRQFDPQVGQPGIGFELAFQAQDRDPLTRQGRRLAVAEPASSAAAGKRHGQQTRRQQACGYGPGGPPGSGSEKCHCGSAE